MSKATLDQPSPKSRVGSTVAGNPLTRHANTHHAQLELKHIQLELQHNRFQHMRHFVDQYYCYRLGYVKRSGTANWEAVVWRGVVSVAARACYPDRKGVVKEHVVPLRVVIDMLKPLAGRPQIDLVDIASILDRFTVFGTITKAEDAALCKAGLKKAVPKEFYEPGHPLFEDLLVRYKHVGIVLESSNEPTCSQGI